MNRQKVWCIMISIGMTGLLHLPSAISADAKKTSDPVTELTQGKDTQEDTINTLIQKMGLTPAQKQQFAKARSEYRTKATSLRTALQEKRTLLTEELDKAQVDKKKVKELIEPVKTLTSQLIDIRVEYAVTLSEILTPAQRTILKENLKNLRHQRTQKEKK